MTQTFESRTNGADRPSPTDERDWFEAAGSLHDHRQHNARLLMIISELLIKNQKLRSDLERNRMAEAGRKPYRLPEEAA